MTDEEPKTWTQRLISDNPALLLSGMYVIASIIGLVYSWLFLNFFGVNFFRYAEIADFFLASLKEPFTWLVAIAAVSLTLMDNANSKRCERRGPGRFFGWYASPRYRQVNYLVAMVMLAVLMLLYADMNHTKVREGKTDLIDVRVAERPGLRRLAMLATTGRFVILFDASTDQVYIYPHENILELTKHAPGRR